MNPTPNGAGGSNAAQRAAQAAFQALQKQAELQEQLNKGTLEYIQLLKDIGKIQKNIQHLTNQRNIEAAKQAAAAQAGNIAEYNAATETLKLLDEEILKLGLIRDAYVSVAKQVNKTAMATKLLFDGAKKLPSVFSKSFGMMKSYGLFDMDKAMKNSALEMGILSKQTLSFREGIKNSVMGTTKLGSSTQELGIGIEELAKIQAEYSSELGTMTTLTDGGNQAMSELAKGTMLGAEGASKLAAEMGLIGKSVEETRDFIQQTMNDSHKMGLNASKVIKNIQANIKLLNKYNFKEGSKGLASMAQSATKLGLDMNTVANMAEKLFDVEGAVEMSAQLQVMGGEWSKLADPFKLMYMARNDMDALYKSVVNATKGIAKLNKEGTEFEIPALEMQRLRKVAEQTGLSFEELAAAGKNAAKFTTISSQISVDVDDETKEFISSTSKLKNGKASININGSDKLLSALTKQDAQQLKVIATNTQALKDRALDAQTFDDKFKYTLSLFKTSLIPVVEGLNDVLGPLVKDMFADKEFKEDLKNLGKRIGSFVAGASTIIKTVGEIAIALGPTGTLATMLIGGVLFEAGKWYANGMALGAGFNTVASSGGAGGAAGNGRSGRGGRGRRMARAAKAGLGGMVLGGITNATTDAGSTMNILGNAAADAMTGAAIGSFLGPVGAAIGGILGGLYGGITAYRSKEVSDGIFKSPVHDGHFDGLGSDFSKGRGIIQGGKITPIDNKDDLIAAKPNGIVDKSMSSSTPKDLNITFGEIKFGGSIMLTSPGNSLSVDLSQELLKNQDFIRSITRMIHIEASKAINGGKISGQPTK